MRWDSSPTIKYKEGKKSFEQISKTIIRLSFIFLKKKKNDNENN